VARQTFGDRLLGTYDSELSRRSAPGYPDAAARFAMCNYPRLSNTSVAWMRSPPPIIPLLPLLAVVMVWSR
jgi:hypothetical protein